MRRVVRRGGALSSVAASALLLGLFAAVDVILVQTTGGQRWDAASLRIGSRYDGSPLQSLAAAWRSALGWVLGGCALVLLWLAARRTRRRRCLLAIALPLTALLASEIIKATLPRPHLGPFGYPVNTLPSAHAATSTALLLGLLLALPDRRRSLPLVAAAWLLATPLAYTSVLTRSHLFSDVVCGVLLAGAVAAVAGLLAGRPIVPSAGRRLWPLVPAGLAAGVLLVGRSDDLWRLALGQLLLVAAATALVWVVLASVDRSGPRSGRS